MTLKKYLPEFVYGSMDGTVTTFAIIAGVTGATLTPTIALILGVSNVLADGFSMASSNFLSERSKENHNINSAFKTAFVTFVSFVIVGFTPILPYIFSLGSDMNSKFTTFQYSCLFTGIVFTLIGLIRGKITGEDKGLAAMETLLIGTIAALIAYYTGFFLKDLI